MGLERYAVCFIVYDAQEFGLEFRGQIAGVHQSFGIAFDARKRSAQLMRYVRDIVASCLLEALLLGDVTEEARGSDDGFFVIFDRHDRGRIRAVFCLDRALVSFTGLKTVIEIFPDFFKRDQLQFLGKKILSGNLFEKRRDRVVGIVRLKILRK